MSSRGSNVGMETSAALVNGIISNAEYHSNWHISEMPPQIIHTMRYFW